MEGQEFHTTPRCATRARRLAILRADRARDLQRPVSRSRYLLAAVAVLLAAAAASAVELRTDTSRALVPLDEIVPGGPPPDGIPAIDRPAFVAPEVAAGWLTPHEPVIALDVGGDARAYPLQVLVWHEIVNDTVGGRAVAVTYCPLCNSGLVFERVVDGRILDFGTSGKVYRSDLVMYDRQTHSLWVQFEGRSIVGALAGARLRLMAANTLAFDAWRTAYPRGKVLSRDTGYTRLYGHNPYVGYDHPDGRPFLFSGTVDPRRPAMERVVGVSVNGVHRAFPWSLLSPRGLVHDEVGGEKLVVLFRPGTLSALDDQRIAASRAVGATGVYSRALGRRLLTFEVAGDQFRDRETGSRWNLLGQAVNGPLRGQRLRPMVHVDAFWFAWAAFYPSTSILQGP